MTKPSTNLPPFAPVDLRAWIEGTSGERDIVGAIRLIQWLEGPEAEIYLAQIVAACFPTSERQVKRDLASTKAKGWLISKRAAKGRLGAGAPTYLLAIEPMAFKTARLTLNLRANLAPRSEEAPGQMELTSGPKSTDLQATQAHANSKEKDLSESPKRETTAVKPPEAGKHPDQGSFWSQAAVIWTTKFPGQRLLWPGTKDGNGVVLSPPIRDFQKLLTGHLTALGLEELVRRWANCVNDPFSRPSLRALVQDVDRWIARREGSGGAKTTRPYNNPVAPAPWRPSSNAIPRT